MGKLAGQTAIVTGAGRGLGRAYALRLARLGAKVAVADVDLKSYAEFQDEAKTMTADTTVDEIRDAGGEALAFEFDIADRNASFAMVDEISAKWGRVDILVANAGGGRGKPSETLASLIPPDLLEQVTQMNFFGTVHSCSAVAPVMKAQRSGKIVTIASRAGIVASVDGGYAHYGANKAAIAHYTRYLAQELGPYGVTANCMAPGLIETARIVKIFGTAETRDASHLDIPLGRAGQPEDCARVLEFLCTDLSDYVTGALIPVDGGWNRAG